MASDVIGGATRGARQPPNLKVCIAAERAKDEEQDWGANRAEPECYRCLNEPDGGEGVFAFCFFGLGDCAVGFIRA